MYGIELLHNPGAFIQRATWTYLLPSHQYSSGTTSQNFHGIPANLQQTLGQSTRFFCEQRCEGDLRSEPYKNANKPRNYVALPCQNYWHMEGEGQILDLDTQIRNKMDAITDRVRRESQQSTQGEQSQGANQGVHMQQEGAPVGDRLERLETRYNDIHSFMQEIRDSISNGELVPAQPGQAQPREQPLGNSLPASDRQRQTLPAQPERLRQRDVRPTITGLGLPPPNLTPQVNLLGRSVRRKDNLQYPAESDSRSRHASPRSRHRPNTQGLDYQNHDRVYPAPSRPRAARGMANSRATDQETTTDAESDTDLDDGRRRNDPTARRLVTHALARQYQQMGHSTGRVHDIVAPAVRPHEALPPDMKRRARDRTGRKNRRDLTMQEYICGYARMLLTEIDPLSDMYAMVSHLAQVAQDAATMPWPTVRTWTTTCLDYIEDGQATWADGNLFMGEKNRIAWAHSRYESTTSIPCPAYNNDQCKTAAPHYEGDMRLLHTCAICYYAAPISQRAESTTHNAKSCNRRKRQGGREEWDGGYKGNSRKPHGNGGGSGGAQYKKDGAEAIKAKN